METDRPVATRWHRIGARAAGSAVIAAVSVALPAGAAAADPASDIVTIGHRGSAGLAPENTLAGIDLAHQHGPDFIEIDVQLSADRIPVMMHDATVARTTNVAEVFPDRAGDPVTSFTYDELQQLDAGSWYGDEYTGERIPTLREVLDHAYPRLGVVIELKNPASSPGLVQVVVDELASDPRWDELAATGRLKAISFDAAAVRELRDRRPDIPVMVLGAIPTSDAELESVAGWADEWGTNYRTLDPADVDRVHRAGMLLNVYTVNSPDHMSTVRELGVDMVTSDFPGVLERVLAGLDPLPDANGVVISGVLANPPGDDLQPETGEHVMLANPTNRPVYLGGYYLHDAVINRLVVGRGYLLLPGEELRVYTGPGSNRRDPRDARYYNDFGRAVLNNGGDSLALFTRTGALVDIFGY
jgi:glycerophosphoryl diester phosphodiesterase